MAIETIASHLTAFGLPAEHDRGEGDGIQPAGVPEPAHTVVVVTENHSYAEIIGNPAAG